MMEEDIETSQQNGITSKNSCSSSNNSTNGLISSGIEENGHASPDLSDYNNSNNNNNNNNGTMIDSEAECQSKTNGQPSDTPSPVSSPPSPPSCMAPPHRASSPGHAPIIGSGHYHHHPGGGVGSGYYLATSCMPASPNHCASPSDSYPSSNASHSGGSGTHSRGESPGEGGGGGGGSSPPGGQHVVHVHVNPGETFSVRLGDQIQHIQG